MVVDFNRDLVIRHLVNGFNARDAPIIQVFMLQAFGEMIAKLYYEIES